MAYRYPKGAKSSATIVVDVIATVSWVDFLLDMKLPHIMFPIDFSKTPKENGELYKKYDKFHRDVIQKMSYRQKVDMFFALADVSNLKIGDETIKTKTLFLAMGEFRNQIAHNPVVRHQVSTCSSRKSEKRADESGCTVRRHFRVRR